MNVRRFRVSGVQPNQDTAFITGTLVHGDAPDPVKEAFRDQVRHQFSKTYPDASRVEEHEWTVDVIEV